MICLDRLHREPTQGYTAYRHRYQNHRPGLHHWLVLLAILISTSSYAISAERDQVAESSKVSETEVNAAIAETVTVAMNTDKGPATYRATGFLHSFSPTAPSDDLVVPLKPRLFRMNASELWAAYPRAKSLGAKTQLVVSDSYGYTRYPGYNGYKSAWESTIAGLVSKADSLGFTDIEWDLWNEPNYSQFWQASTQQFYDTWEIGCLKLRSLKPGAVVVGPSSTGSMQYVKDFLLYAKAHNVLPNVISFHVIWDDERNIPYYVSNLRSFMASNNINIQKISINEYISYDGSDQHITTEPDPGSHARLLANLEYSGVDSAAKSVWSSGYTLDNVAPGKKTSLWWVYKAYADITGRIVQVTSSSTIDGVAGKDLASASARVLLGRYSTSPGDIAVAITGLDQVGYLVSGGAIHVVAERITKYTSGSVLPQRVIDADYLISNNKITVVLPSFAPMEAFVLTLSSPDPTPYVPAGPVAAYNFEEGTGTATADVSGHGNNGTLINGTLWTTGKTGKGLSFDGVNDSVMVPNNSALMPSTTITVAAWFNASAQQVPFATLIGKTANSGYWLGIDWDGLNCGVPNSICGKVAVSGGYKIIHSQAIAYSIWNHVAMTYDGATARLYYNGVQVDSNSFTGVVLSNTEPLCIGTDPDGGTCSGGPFKGLLDQVRIWNRALSASEVYALANSIVPDTTAPSVSLTAPLSGATVSGTAVTVSANATDNVAVAGVQFMLDGANLGSEDTVAPYSIAWNTTLKADGNHILSAVARDSSGNKTTALSVTVTIKNSATTLDTVPPQISITSPVDGARVSKNSDVTISAQASDNILVSKVEFYVDGVLKGTDTVPESTNISKYVWRVPSPKGVTYRLKVVAYDASNNSASASISVTSS